VGKPDRAALWAPDVCPWAPSLLQVELEGIDAGAKKDQVIALLKAAAGRL